VFEKAIDRAEEAEELKQRVNNLIDGITYSVFVYASRGLFERDKLTFTAQMTIQVLTMSGDIDPTELEFLLRYPVITNVYSPVDFLSHTSWGGIKVRVAFMQPSIETEQVLYSPLFTRKLVAIIAKHKRQTKYPEGNVRWPPRVLPPSESR